MPAKPAPTLVVVSHYDARPRRDLDALLHQLATVPAGAPFDVLVVVNQTRAEPTAVTAPLPGLRVLHRENTGFNIGAWEHGLRASRGHASYLFLQDECRIARDGWLAPFVARLRRPGVGLVGERLNPAWAAAWPELERRFAGHTLPDHHVDGAPAERLAAYRAFWRRHGIDAGERGDHLQTLVLAARRDVLERAGGFPVGADYGEAIAAEIGISKRVQALGLTVEQIGPKPFTWIGHAQWQGRDDAAPLAPPRQGLDAWLALLRSERTFDDRPWLVLGKGPTFALRTAAQLREHHTLGLNHVVREQAVDVAHAIDVDVVAACREHLDANCRFLLMPRVPHVRSAPGDKLLEQYFAEIPELYELELQGRLVWYSCSTAGRSFAGSPTIDVRWFSSEAALAILAAMGVRRIRSLGVDGGRRYSSAFVDLDATTRLQNGQPLFDRQFERIAAIVREHGIDYAPLVPPLRVAIACGAGDELPAAVLEHSLRVHAALPLAVERLPAGAPPPPGAIVMPAHALALGDVAAAARAGDSGSAVHTFAGALPWREPSASDAAALAWLDAFAELVAHDLLSPRTVRAAVRTGHADARLLALPPPTAPAGGDELALAEHRARALRRELANLRLSRAWQVGRWLTAPLRRVHAGGRAT
jgi:hypothetical protein